MYIANRDVFCHKKSIVLFNISLFFIPCLRYIGQRKNFFLSQFCVLTTFYDLMNQNHTNRQWNHRDWKHQISPDQCINYCYSKLWLCLSRCFFSFFFFFFFFFFPLLPCMMTPSSNQWIKSLSDTKFCLITWIYIQQRQ